MDRTLTCTGLLAKTKPEKQRFSPPFMHFLWGGRSPLALWLASSKEGAHDLSPGWLAFLRLLLARCQQGQSHVTLPARQLLEISWLAKACLCMHSYETQWRLLLGGKSPHTGLPAHVFYPQNASIRILFIPSSLQIFPQSHTKAHNYYSNASLHCHSI